MPLHVPGLARKLQCLYQQHHSITSHELLAKSLGIAPNNISVWINGNDVRVPDLVPNRHVKHLTEVFEIPLEWLELESLDQFKNKLKSPDSSASISWTRVLEQAIGTDVIQLVRSTAGDISPTRHRGLVADDAEMPEQFNVGERLYISVALEDAWPKRMPGGPLGVMALCVDAANTSCLCPSVLAPSSRLNGDSLRIPQAAPGKSLKVSGPVGLQSVLILLSSRLLPNGVLEALTRGRIPEALDELAGTLLATPVTDWRLLRKDYEVS